MSLETPVEQGQAVAVCWCCGNDYPADRVVHLGSHPEVALCLDCARYLHLRAAERRDALRPSRAARVRDVLRTGRRVVIQRGWHHKPLVGPVLRWLGRHLP